MRNVGVLALAAAARALGARNTGNIVPGMASSATPHLRDHVSKVDLFQGITHRLHTCLMNVAATGGHVLVAGDTVAQAPINAGAR